MTRVVAPDELVVVRNEDSSLRRFPPGLKRVPDCFPSLLEGTVTWSPAFDGSDQPTPEQFQTASETWRVATLGLTAAQLEAFAHFVDDTDPAAYASPDLLEALRVTFAFLRNPEAYPDLKP
jgi:hypothetical protein